MTHRYAKQPEWTRALLRGERPSTQAVYAVLLAWRPWHADDTDRPCTVASPARVRIAEETGLTERMVRSATSRLAELGLVRKWHRGAGRAQCYILAWDGPFSPDPDPMFLLNVQRLLPAVDDDSTEKGKKGKKGKRDPVDNPRKGKPISPFTTSEGKRVSPYRENVLENVSTHLPASLTSARASDDEEQRATRTGDDDDAGGGVRPQAAAADTDTTQYWLEVAKARAAEGKQRRAEREAERRAALAAEHTARRTPRPSSAPLPETRPTAEPPASAPDSPPAVVETKDAGDETTAEQVPTGSPTPPVDVISGMAAWFVPTQDPEAVRGRLEARTVDDEVYAALEPVDVLGYPITDDDYAAALTGTDG